MQPADTRARSDARRQRRNGVSGREATSANAVAVEDGHSSPASCDPYSVIDRGLPRARSAHPLEVSDNVAASAAS